MDRNAICARGSTLRVLREQLAGRIVVNENAAVIVAAAVIGNEQCGVRVVERHHERLKWSAEALLGLRLSRREDFNVRSRAGSFAYGDDEVAAIVDRETVWFTINGN